MYSVTELAHAIIAALLSLGVLHSGMLSASRLATLSLLGSLAPPPEAVASTAPAAEESAPPPSPASEAVVSSHDNAVIGI